MLSSLNTALSGLSAARIAVENVSNNIANEHTPGYKKRTVQLNEVTGLDSQIYGRGVLVGGTIRTTDQFMYDNIMKESAKKNYYATMSNMLGDIESVFKETDTSGFSNDLNRYFQAMENLRSNPSSEIYKTDLKNQGTVIVDDLNRLYDGIEAQERVSTKSLERDVERVNELLSEMGKINNQISQSKNASNVLLDQRDQLEAELGKYVDIEVDRSSYDYELRIGGKVALRYGDNVRTFTVNQDDIAQSDKYLVEDSSGVVQSSLKFESGEFNEHDIIKYKFDNDIEVSLEFGEEVDLNKDGLITADEIANNDNYIRLLSHKINNNTDLSGKVTAFNGTYKVDADGNKITNDKKDNYLFIEADEPGPEGRFEARIVIEEHNAQSTPGNISTLDNKTAIFKDEYQSKDGSTKIKVMLFDQEVEVSSGSISAYIENLQTDSGSNKFQKYKDELDQFAKTLSDLTSQYVRNDDNTYIYGAMTIDANKNPDGSSISKSASFIGNGIGSDGLFSGSSVRSLTFNKDVVSYLDQNKLDYLATLQWKDDISFQDGSQGELSATGQLEDVNTSSFSEFFQRLNLDVSRDKENNDFLLETQNVVLFSLEETYNQIVKVDPDEEMLNLVKFQSAYAANAKIIQAIDEMIQIMLGLKR